VHVVQQCFHRDELGNILAPAWTLERLVFDLANTNASNPRDKIYALLSIASDIDLENPEIVPDYFKTVVEVHTDFHHFCLEKSNSLDVLFRAWSRDSPAPIWIPRPDVNQVVTTLVPAPDQPPPYAYHQPPAIYGVLSVSEDNLLKFNGFVFDQVNIADATNDTHATPLRRSWLVRFQVP
jgi:hypothetical protein